MKRCRLCPRQDWAARAADGSFASGGRLPVNLSGGVLTFNPVFCTGLIRIAEVANQVRGRAGAHQVANARLRAGACRQRVRHAVSGGRRAGAGGTAMSTDRVGIIGIGQSEFRSRRDDASYPELVREGVVPAMQDAGLDFDAIEAVVYSLSPDAMVGIGNAERLGVDAVGGRNKPFLRINTGGATGISSVAAAYYHIASGVLRRRADRRRRQGRRVRRFADRAEQDLGPDATSVRCRLAPSTCWRCRRCATCSATA